MKNDKCERNYVGKYCLLKNIQCLKDFWALCYHALLYVG